MLYMKTNVIPKIKDVTFWACSVLKVKIIIPSQFRTVF